MASLTQQQKWCNNRRKRKRWTEHQTHKNDIEINICNKNNSNKILGIHLNVCPAIQCYCRIVSFIDPPHQNTHTHTTLSFLWVSPGHSFKCYPAGDKRSIYHLYCTPPSIKVFKRVLFKQRSRVTMLLFIEEYNPGLYYCRGNLPIHLGEESMHLYYFILEAAHFNRWERRCHLNDV